MADPAILAAGAGPVLAILAGAVFAGGAYLMMSTNLVRVIFGLALLSNGVNLAILVAGRVVYARPAFVPEGAATAPAGVAPALPQALILTAIVIGFGLLVVALALVVRTFAVFGTVEAPLLDDDVRREEAP